MAVINITGPSAVVFASDASVLRKDKISYKRKSVQAESKCFDLMIVSRLFFQCLYGVLFV